MAPPQPNKPRPDDNDAQSDVALLIDYENLQVSLKRHFNLTTPKMSLIIQEALEYGRLVLSRAYAPWTAPELSIDAENLYRQGIDLIYTPAGKNSADVRMAVDAVDLVARRGTIGTILFVTGDGDLIHPLNYLRQQGARVVVIGVDAAMSRMLASAADAVLIYERDLDPSVRSRVVEPRRQQRSHPQQKSPTSKPATPEAKPAAEATQRLNPQNGAPSAEDAFKLVRQVIQAHGDGEPMLYQEIGHWLGREHSMKPRTSYGVPFSVFMDAAQESGMIALTTSGGNSYASLPSTGEEQIDESDSEDEETTDSGTGVRLESLQPEERSALLDALNELDADPKLRYFTFRTILRHLVDASSLPRLNEQQIRSLLNDLANRTPPILIRSQRRGRNPQGGTYTFASFTLTQDAELLEQELGTGGPTPVVDGPPTPGRWDTDTVRVEE